MLVAVLISGLILWQAAIEQPFMKEAGDPVRLIAWRGGRHPGQTSRLPPGALGSSSGP